MALTSPNPAALAKQRPLEDPLAYLPCSTIGEYRKGQLIYSQDQPSTSIYLLISGRVKVSRITVEGRQVVVDIYQPDEFFGEAAVLGLAHNSEQATALENTNLMRWTVAEIESIVARRPQLAVAFLQILAQRTMHFAERIESLAVDSVPRRLARSLLYFAKRIGVPENDGSVRLGPFTHELLAQYVGTSREIVTHHMNHFRKEGYLRYSRQEVIVYHGPLQEWLRRTKEPDLALHRTLVA